MRARRWTLYFLGLTAAAAVAAFAGDTGIADTPEAGSPPVSSAAPTVDASRPAVYVPPSRGTMRTRTGGGTRGPGPAPTVSVIAPDHAGITTRAQPELAFFVSAATDARIDLTVIQADAVDPLLETTLPGPISAGVHLVRLADHGVTLAEDTSYDWSVALVLDPARRDLDVAAGSAIRREPAAPAVAQALASGAPSYRVLAGNGIWYDAIADLSDAIAAAPGDAALRAERAGLLEQVGLDAAAAFERGSATHDVSAQPRP
jgi:hypothetical protein